MITEQDKWNRAADNYQSVLLQGITEYNLSVLNFWTEQGMLRPGCRVLDIGCGVGKYGTCLAQLGCDVTLTDISDRMIALAGENMARYTAPWRTVCCDFNEITGEEAAFAEGFDLAISTMAPAVHDVETVKRMSRMSSGWCFLSRFYQWEQPFRDRLSQLLRLPIRPAFENDLLQDCRELLQAVEKAGFCPQTKLVDYAWADRRSKEEMADYLLRQLFPDLPDPDAFRRKAMAGLAELCDADGYITDDINTKVMWIFWKTEDTP